MSSLPLVRGTAQALYPFTKRWIFDTGIAFNCNGTEQRWKRNAPKLEFEWQWNDLFKTDATGLVTHFSDVLGMYGATWTFQLGSTVYSNLSLQSDLITVLQNGPMTYSTTMVARQTQNRGWTAPSVANAWPTFSSGASLQIPYQASYRTLTTAGDSPSGTRYAFPWWSGTLSGFPSIPLRRFPIAMDLPDVDAETLETFFCWAQGRLKTFDYHDPVQNSDYWKIRFEQDTLELRYLDVNHVQVNVSLIEIN